MSIKYLGSDEAVNLCSFLTAQSIAHLTMTGKTVKQVIDTERIWCHVCQYELDLDFEGDIAERLPPGLANDGVAALRENPVSAKQLFIIWRRSFAGYSTMEVSAMRQWWRRMESWLASNAPTVLDTLDPPATTSDISKTEMRLKNVGKTIPRMLKLMYRFHNGQRVDYGHFLYGLFGSHYIYDELISMRFLPLEIMTVFSENFGVANEVCVL
jgi:cell wall assembly regulator SMI1